MLHSGRVARTPTETEIKLRLRNLRIATARLRRAGFRLHHPRTFETNFVLDTPSSTLRSEGRLLRLRQFGDRNMLTFKGASVPAKHKSREELEVAVGNLDEMRLVLERLGYFLAF